MCRFYTTCNSFKKETAPIANQRGANRKKKKPSIQRNGTYCRRHPANSENDATPSLNTRHRKCTSPPSRRELGREMSGFDAEEEKALSSTTAVDSSNCTQVIEKTTRIRQRLVLNHFQPPTRKFSTTKIADHNGTLGTQLDAPITQRFEFGLM